MRLRVLVKPGFIKNGFQIDVNNMKNPTIIICNTLRLKSTSKRQSRWLYYVASCRYLAFFVSEDQRIKIPVCKTRLGILVIR